MNGVARDGQHLDAALPVDVVHSDLPQHRQPQGPEIENRNSEDKVVEAEINNPEEGGGGGGQNANTGEGPDSVSFHHCTLSE